MKVYLVRDGALQTVAVFSTESAAKAFIASAFIASRNPGVFSWDVEEMEVDAA